MIENLTVSATFTYTSGIEEVVCDRDERAVVYDLRGRRVDVLLPGNIYVRDGKKIIFIKDEKYSACPNKGTQIPQIYTDFFNVNDRIMSR